MSKHVSLLTVIAVSALLLAACGAAAPESNSLVIYSGRGESLVGPLVEMFEAESGIDVEVRYGGTAEMAATLLEEGEASPADLLYAQDPGGLGAVAEAGLLAALPADVLNAVPAGFADPEGHWVGVSGRARVVVYNTDTLSPADLPDDLHGFTDAQWKGLIGIAPTNGSWQIMITALRQVWGEAATEAWLEGIMANEPVLYENNSGIVAAVGAGEVQVGFVNHYYLYRFLAEEGESFPARNYFLPGGGPGSLVMVSGVGQLATAANAVNAQTFIEFLLSETAQTYFRDETFEYPVTAGVAAYAGLTPLSELNSPDIDLADLADLQGTVALLQSVGMLP
jgi:iron(III) transport system substrate-binding protein